MAGTLRLVGHPRHCRSARYHLGILVHTKRTSRNGTFYVAIQTTRLVPCKLGGGGSNFQDGVGGQVPEPTSVEYSHTDKHLETRTIGTRHLKFFV